MDNLYEKLYRENQQLKESEYKREMYLRKWKKAFGYDTSVSFDKVLEDLLELSHNKDCAVTVDKQPTPKPSNDGFAQS